MQHKFTSSRITAELEIYERMFPRLILQISTGDVITKHIHMTPRTVILMRQVNRRFKFRSYQSFYRRKLAFGFAGVRGFRMFQTRIPTELNTYHRSRSSCKRPNPFI